MVAASARAEAIGAWDQLEAHQRQQLAAIDPVLWAHHASDGVWQLGPHLEFLADKLLDLFHGRIKRLVISLPPRHGKTTFGWGYFGSWWLGRRPTSKIIGVTYQKRQAGKWSRLMRDALAAHGPEVFGVGASTRAAAEEWHVLRSGFPTGGVSYAVGTGGAITGKGGDLIICDDLVKGIKEVRNPAVREAAWEWFVADLLSRMETVDTAVLVIGTRWHDDDVIGRIEKSQKAGEPIGGEPWTIINVPLISEDNDPMGRAPGEALWPQRWPIEWARKKERGTPAHIWSPLYRGKPLPAQGGLMRAEWWRYFEEVNGELVGPGSRVLAAATRRFVTVDPAWSKKTSADWTAIASWAIDQINDRLYLLELRRERLTAAEVAKAVDDAAEACGASEAFLERSAFASDQMKIVRQKLQTFAREVQPNIDKVARFIPVTDYAATGRLLLRARAPWLPMYQEELLKFPLTHDNDDQVDATSLGVHVAAEASWRNGDPPEAPEPPADEDDRPRPGTFSSPVPPRK